MENRAVVGTMIVMIAKTATAPAPKLRRRVLVRTGAEVTRAAAEAAVLGALPQVSWPKMEAIVTTKRRAPVAPARVPVRTTMRKPLKDLLKKAPPVVVGVSAAKRKVVLRRRRERLRSVRSVPKKRKQAEKEARAQRKTELKAQRTEIENGLDLYKKAAHIWTLRTVIKNYIALLVEAECVRGKPLAAFLKEAQASHGHQAKVAALELPTCYEELDAASLKLSEWRNQIDHWKFPCVFKNHRVELVSLCDRWVAAVCEGRRHISALLGLFDEGKKATADANDKFRKGRGRYRNWLAEFPVPASMRKPYGDYVHAHEIGAAKASPHMSHYTSPKEPRNEITLNTFAESFLVDGTRLPESERTYLEKGVSKFYDDHTKAVVARRYEAQTTMTKDGRESAIGTVDCVSHVDMNPDPEHPIVSPLKSLRLQVTGVWENRCPLALESDPLRAHGHFFLPFVGSFIVAILPPDVAVEHSDLSSYVTNLGAGDLTKYQTFLVHPRQAVWVPLGSVAVKCAVHRCVDFTKPGEVKELPKRRTKAGAEQKSCACYGNYFIWDATMLADIGTQTKRMLASQWIQAQDWISPSYKESSELSTWRELLKA